MLHQLLFQSNDFTGDGVLGGTGVSGLRKGTPCASSPLAPRGKLSMRASSCDFKQQLLTVVHVGGVHSFQRACCINASC